MAAALLLAGLASEPALLFALVTLGAAAGGLWLRWQAPPAAPEIEAAVLASLVL